MTPIWKAPPSPSAVAIKSSEDVLAFTNANGITGSWDSSGGVLTLSGSASKANYETAFESITYQNTNTDDPDNTDRTVTWVVNDGTSNSSGVTSTITVADANDAPVVSDAGATLAYTEGDSATVIDGTLTITDVDDTNMEGATITISSGYQSSEDVLCFYQCQWHHRLLGQQWRCLDVERLGQQSQLRDRLREHHLSEHQHR